MKPLVEYLVEYDTMWIELGHTLIIEILRQADYYEVSVPYDNKLSNIKTMKRHFEFVKWTWENCANDSYACGEIFFFTNTEIATMMKLSVL